MPLSMPHFLAAYTSTTVVRIFVPLLILLVLAAVLIGALAFVRRKMHDGGTANTPRDFSLGDLRRLHRQGQLTDEEFERAKSKLVGTVQATLKKEAKPSRVEEPFAEEFKDA